MDSLKLSPIEYPVPRKLLHLPFHSNESSQNLFSASTSPVESDVKSNETDESTSKSGRFVPSSLRSDWTDILHLRVMSYNTLAQTCMRRDIFSYCSQQALKWTYRRNILLKEVLEAKCHIICLQVWIDHEQTEYNFININKVILYLYPMMIFVSRK